MGDEEVREWFVDAVWGKIALISWGDASLPPVLLMHGFLDTAATFYYLVQHLPRSYYYVALDLPGNGKSAPFPPGPLPNTALYVEAMRVVVDSCEWTEFVLLAHSLGFMIGVMYNQAYPDKISSMINIEPSLAVSLLQFTIQLNLWIPHRYQMYYDEMEKLKHKGPRIFTREQAIKRIMRERRLSEQQAAVVLSRALVPVGQGTYRLSWTPNSKLIYMLALPGDTFFAIATSNPKPMLFLHASDDVTPEEAKSFKNELFQKITSSLPNVKVATVVGAHDVHITNPGQCAKLIDEFLNLKFDKNKKAKL